MGTPTVEKQRETGKAKEEKNTNNQMNKSTIIQMRFNILRLLDYILISLKIFTFLDILYYYMIAQTQFSKEIYGFFLIPGFAHGICNLLRLFYRNNKYLLYFEILLNIIFLCFLHVPNELLFLIFTLVSLSIVLFFSNE